VILVDTSAWIEYDHATGSDVDHFLTRAISEHRPIAATEPVLMEVLAGARSEAAASTLRRLLTSFDWIPADAVADFEGASAVYQKCRAAGVTPGGLVDCMITAIAIRSGATILAADGDFERMGRVLPLSLVMPA
jgi:predicted nucleic acid-binding protein